MYHVEKTDVVVLGAGAAGTMSAIYAHRTNPKLRVVVLDKSKMEDTMKIRVNQKSIKVTEVLNESLMERVIEVIEKSGCKHQMKDFGTTYIITGTSEQLNNFIDIWNRDN